jgi:ABC-type nitrate/sulfonate/bicarbonate transport system substrate-binding protein
MNSERHLRAGVAFVLLCLGLLGAAWLLFGAALFAPRGPQVLTVALPTSPSVGAFFLADNKGLFERHGVAPKFDRRRLGKDALQAVVDGKADLALVADTPFMLAVLRGEQIATIGTVFQSRRSMALLARSERGLRSGADLAGKTVGLVPGTNAEFFFDAMLGAHGIARSQVKVVELGHEQLAGALRSGRVDAIAIWTPLLSQLQREFGKRAITIHGVDLFVNRFLIAARADTIASHPDALRRLLAAIDEANAMIREQPAMAQAVIGAAVGLDAAMLARGFNAGDYALALDQSLLLALGAQTRWAMERGIVAPGQVPNFLEHVRQRPLAAALPSAVRIIR